MKLSVLITTYNLVKYIDETIKSVLAQKTNFKFEILIGDDGSNDGTIDKIINWQEKYPDIIKYFVMDRKVGVKYNKIERASKNRINLIEHATGEFLIFLDGDDFYTDNRKLQKQVDVLENKEYSNCIACAHNASYYWSEQNKKPVNKYNKKFVINASDYWKWGLYFFNGTVLFRNIFNGNFPKEVNQKYFDDNIIIFYLLKHGNILYLPDNMVNYRQIEVSCWNSVDNIEKNIINLMDLDIEKQINKKLYKESYIRHTYNIFYLWLFRKKINNIKYNKYLLQAKKDDLKKTKYILEYKDLKIKSKLLFTIKLFINVMKFIFVRLIKCIKLNRFRRV